MSNFKHSNKIGRIISDILSGMPEKKVVEKHYSHLPDPEQALRDAKSDFCRGIWKVTSGPRSKK